MILRRGELKTEERDIAKKMPRKSQFEKFKDLGGKLAVGAALIFIVATAQRCGDTNNYTIIQNFGKDAAQAEKDAGKNEDANQQEDAWLDAGIEDSGELADASEDAGFEQDAENDAGMQNDAGSAEDAGEFADAGEDAGLKPLSIDNLTLDVSPFGKEVTISWTTERPANSYLEVWDEPYIGKWPVYDAVQKTNHTITVDTQGIISPERSYGLFVMSEEFIDAKAYTARSDVQHFKTQKPHLLIVLSQKYSNDADIDAAVAKYSTAIGNESWVADIAKLDASSNFDSIKWLLADRKLNNNTPAALLVGEDIPFSYFILEKEVSNIIARPLLQEWMEINKTGDPVVDEMEVVVSLLVPTPNSQMKEKDQVINAFTKFSMDRDKAYPEEVALFYDPTVAQVHAPDYPEFKMVGNLTVYDKAGPQDAYAYKDQSLKLLTLTGHGTPYGVQVNPDYNGQGSVGMGSWQINDIDLPFLIVAGCDTFSWFVNAGETVPKSDFFMGWFPLGHKSIRAVVAGLPTQISETYKYPPEPLPNFIGRSLPKIAKGQSIAESVYNATFFNMNVVLHGDPTFRYTTVYAGDK
ncbi:MAG: hypothetical protein V1492_04505 [Candidatus Micrarchaeota archaeon]